MNNSQRDRLTALGVCTIVFFLYLPGLNYHKLLADAFYLTPLRMLNGELLGRDISISVHGFLRFYLYALLYEIFGVKTITLRILAPIILALMSGSAYLVARKLKINRFLSLICAVVVLHTLTATYAVDNLNLTSDRHLFAFIAFLILHPLINSHRKIYYFFAGLFTGITVSYAQDIGVYLLAAYLAFMGILGILSIKGKYTYISFRGLLQRNIFAFAGFAVFMIPLILYLYSRGILYNAYEDLFLDVGKLYNYGHLSLNNITSLAIIPGSLSIQELKYSFLIFRFFFIIALYVCLGLWLLKRMFQAQKVTNDELFLTFILIYSAFSAFTAYRSFDSQHISFISQPFYLLAAWTMQRIYPAIQLKRNFGTLKSLLGAAVVLIIAANLLFSGIIVARVLSKTYLLKGFEFSSVHAPGIRVVDTPELRDYIDVVRYLDSVVPIGEPIYSIEFVDVTNFLIDRPNIMEFRSIQYFTQSPQLIQRDLPKILDRLPRVKYILIWRRGMERFENNFDLFRGGELTKFKEHFKDYYDYVFERYTLDKKFGTFEVWKRLN